jgi:hypothetical protein
VELEETFLEAMERIVGDVTEDTGLEPDSLRELAARLWFVAKRSVDNKFLKELCTAFVWAADEIERGKDRLKWSAINKRMYKKSDKPVKFKSKGKRGKPVI